ncbi:hypothetical protein LCGC14_1610590 [marine sediment metagenome]|uniref:Uncharacterized protein n=1 Tax=marine sediment metagenome TaxID=412755 RepID=A0A0F9IV52_9ZZZZ|nr:hypothetical protein [Candidatus Scalindua sp.]
MKFKPSAVEEYLSTLPLEWQVRGLQIVDEEVERWKHHKLTLKEREFVDNAKKMGISMAKKRESIAKEVLNGR